jgi:hypothetical protein
MAGCSVSLHVLHVLTRVGDDMRAVLAVVCWCAGEEVTVDMEQNVLTNHTTGKTFKLNPIGDVSDWGQHPARDSPHTLRYVWGKIHQPTCVLEGTRLHETSSLALSVNCVHAVLHQQPYSCRQAPGLTSAPLPPPMVCVLPAGRSCD